MKTGSSVVAGGEEDDLFSEELCITNRLGCFVEREAVPALRGRRRPLFLDAVLPPLLLCLLLCLEDEEEEEEEEEEEVDAVVVSGDRNRVLFREEVEVRCLLFCLPCCSGVLPLLLPPLSICVTERAWFGVKGHRDNSFRVSASLDNVFSDVSSAYNLSMDLDQSSGLDKRFSNSN